MVCFHSGWVQFLFVELLFFLFRLSFFFNFAFWRVEECSGQFWVNKQQMGIDLFDEIASLFWIVYWFLIDDNDVEGRGLIFMKKLWILYCGSCRTRCRTCG